MRSPSFKLFSFSTVLFVTLVLFLTACSDTPVTPPDTGTLQVTVVGLPANVEAAVEVTGPNDYSQTLKRSQTLQLPTGTYELSIATVVAAGITYAGELDKASVDVALSQTATVTATYTLVGQVGANEIAPGVTRTGQVPAGALKDYMIRGVENVPLLFDFIGTEAVEGIAQYTLELYKADDLGTPLFSQNASNNQANDPFFTLTPPSTGDYLLRIRGVSGTIVYQVSASYLSGSPEERATPEVLTSGATYRGGVTVESYNDYRFTGRIDTAVVFDFAYDLGDRQLFTGTFFIELYAAGSDEPLAQYGFYSTSGVPPNFSFTPQADGDYVLRVVGLSGIVKYRFSVEGLE